jgi:alginate O-acetyltransferase complex protein AlgI
VVFSSITFLFYFLPLFLVLYYVLPCRNTVILLASLLFYAWGEPRYIPLLLVYILINWAFGLLIPRSARWGGRFLTAGVTINIAMLVWFKYLTFLFTQLGTLGVALGLPAIPGFDVALPLGISFFTFQGISYLIDIHRGTVVPQRSLLKFAMYKAMFPQLIAGPIVRYAQVARQINVRPISAWRVRTGMLMFLCGLAQKVLIADNVAPTADMVFALPAAQLTAAAAWAGAICYAIQIFFDFGGYSNMAIGLGQMMGFSFPANFNRPYVARSVSEFWHRWHMTLSAWFRDYLYIPLGGNRFGALRTYGNLAAVFLLCGLWHGAAWNFAAWGAWQGAFLTLERLGLATVLARLWRPFQHLYLLLAVLFGWVLFRADGIGNAGDYMAAMLGFAASGQTQMPLGAILPPIAITALLAGSILCAVAWPSERMLRHRLRRRPVSGLVPHAVTDHLVSLTVAAVALVLGGLSTLSLAGGTYSPFIYFRF